MICELASGIEESVRCCGDSDRLPLLKRYTGTVMLSGRRQLGDRWVCIATNGLCIKTRLDACGSALWTNQFAKQAVSSAD